MKKTKNTIRFPEKISFCNTYNFYEQFNDEKELYNTTFDCSKTNEIHISFLGFLIFTTEKIKSKNLKVSYKLSPYVKKLIQTHHLLNYFKIDKYKAFYKICIK